MYGIWNAMKKEWQFGISEPTERKAWQALYNKIGKDAYKWRFEIKKLPVQNLKKPLYSNNEGEQPPK